MSGVSASWLRRTNPQGINTMQTNSSGNLDISKLGQLHVVIKSIETYEKKQNCDI
jgi:hypothetical protein